MTVSTSTSRIAYTGNGVTVSFSVPFPFIQDDYLIVIRTVISTGVETILTLDSPGADGYSVTGAGNPSGSVIVVTAPSALERLSIIRSVDATQEADFVANDPLPSEVIEDSLDKLTMLFGDLSQGNGLSRVPVLYESDIDGSGRYNSNGNRYANAADGVNPDDLATVQQVVSAGSGDFIQAGAGAVIRTMQDKARERVTPQDFGAQADGVTDDTAAIVAAHAASNQVHYPAGRYLVTMQNSAALVTYTADSNISITGDSAVIYDPRAYTGDPFAPVFDFIGCSNVEVIGVNYEGSVLSSPSTELGILGATFVRWRNGSSNLRVDAEVVNARYGILSGNYSDYSQGDNKDVKARLRTTLCGYPVAFYWVTGVDIHINADGVHRAAYLAGVSGGRVEVLWKDQYIADVAALCTDALVGVSTLRGCSDLKVISYDQGSTVFQTSSACCGVANSRQTSEIIHENMYFEFGVKSTDSISTNVGGFKLFSGPLPGGEPFFWEPTTYLRNIKISGVIDRAGQTVDSNAAGDVYWVSNDTGAHVATVSNITIQDVTIIPSSGTTRNCFFEASGLLDVVTFRNVVSSGAVGVRLATAVGAKTVFESCKLPALVSGGTTGTLEFDHTVIASMPSDMTALGSPVNGSTLTGAGMTLRMKETVLSLSGPSTTWAGAIPAGSVVLGCVSRIQTDITGATGYLLGIGADTSRWANVNNIAAGLVTTPNNYGAAGLVPQIYGVATSIVATAKTSDFTGGTLKVTLFYFDTTSPTA